MNSLAEKLIKRTNWSSYDEINGKANAIGHNLELLINSRDVETTRSVYWNIENHIVVQGSVYNSAIPVSSILVASLLEHRPEHVKVAIFNLLYQILSASPADANEPDCVDRCIKCVREGITIIVNEYINGLKECAGDVLELLGSELDYLSLY